MAELDLEEVAELLRPAPQETKLVAPELRKVPEQEPTLGATNGRQRRAHGAPLRFDMARRTRSGVRGSSVMRAPVAAWTALAMTAPPGMIGGSPTGLAPN